MNIYFYKRKGLSEMYFGIRACKTLNLAFKSV